MDFWEGLEVFFLSLFGWVLVDAVNIDVCCCCCCLYYFLFSTFKSGPCEDPKPEAEVKCTTVGLK